MEDLDPTIQSIIMMFVGGGISFLFAWYWYEKRLSTDRKKIIADQHDALVARVELLDKSLALLTQSVQPISIAFQDILVKELTHFHTPDMDKLLTKLGPPYLLTRDEELILTSMLANRTRDMSAVITESEREAAIMLPLVIKRVRVETQAMKEHRFDDIMLVAVNMGERQIHNRRWDDPVHDPERST
jgi:hypothetical protein